MAPWTRGGMLVKDIPLTIVQHEAASITSGYCLVMAEHSDTKVPSALTETHHERGNREDCVHRRCKRHREGK